MAGPPASFDTLVEHPRRRSVKHHVSLRVEPHSDLSKNQLQTRIFQIWVHSWLFERWSNCFGTFRLARPKSITSACQLARQQSPQWDVCPATTKVDIRCFTVVDVHKLNCHARNSLTFLFFGGLNHVKTALDSTWSRSRSGVLTPAGSALAAARWRAVGLEQVGDVGLQFEGLSFDVYIYTQHKYAHTIYHNIYIYV